MKNRKYIYFASVIGIFGAIFAGLVYANPSFFAGQRAIPSLTSTTTAVALTPGTATNTSLVYDAYQVVQGDSTRGLNPTSADLLTLAIQLEASSTRSTLNFRIEDSTDNIDWYARGDVTNLNATTSILTQDYQEYRWRFASSTGGGSSGTANSNRLFQSFNIPIRMRYTRIVFYAPPWPAFPFQPTTTPSQNLMIWATLIPAKERAE